MRRYSRLFSASMVALLAVTPACSGMGSNASPATVAANDLVRQDVVARPSRVSPGHAILERGAACPKAGLRFVSDASDSEIDIYPATGATMCGQIRNSAGLSLGLSDPGGIAVDGAGTLYVANTDASNVLEFPPPYAKLGKVLADPGQYPTGVAVCKGYVAVTNVNSTTFSPGSVSIYLGSATKPSRTLTDANAWREYFPVCDAAGNLFTSYMNAAQTGGFVNEWIGGKGAVKELAAISTSFPGGLDYEGNALWVGDQGSSAITKYAAPYAKAGKSIALGCGSTCDIVTFRVNAADNAILGADASNSKVDTFSLTGNLLQTMDNPGLPIGTAYQRDDAF